MDAHNDRTNSEQMSGMNMGDYWFGKEIAGEVSIIEETLRKLLEREGFGVVTEISMHKTLSEKIGVVIPPYRILGVCSPAYAHRMIQTEENIGLFLPCKIILKQKSPGVTEVVAINPTALMQMLQNGKLFEIAEEVTQKFRKVLQELR